MKNLLEKRSTSYLLIGAVLAAAWLICQAFAAEINLTVKGQLTADQVEALRFLWKSSGNTNVPLRDFATNYVRLEVSDVVKFAREQRLSRIQEYLRNAGDDQLDAVEKSLGIR